MISGRKPYTLQDIENGLRNPRYFYESARNGNEDAIHQLVDSRLALEKADPTVAQMKALELVWEQEYTLKEAGEALGISKEGVRFNLQLLSVKLQQVVEEWAEREKYAC